MWTDVCEGVGSATIFRSIDIKDGNGSPATRVRSIMWPVSLLGGGVLFASKQCFDNYILEGMAALLVHCIPNGVVSVAATLRPQRGGGILIRHESLVGWH